MHVLRVGAIHPGARVPGLFYCEENMRFILLLFVILPIIELIVLIEVGSAIGALYTIGLVLLTAVIGAALLRSQGLVTLLRANQRLQSGEIPAQEVCEGFLLAVGGALLLTPGFITDAVGFLCLLPGTRHWLVGKILKRAIVTGQGAFFGGSFDRGPGAGAHRGSERRDRDGNIIIEGEVDHEHESGRPDAHLDHQPRDYHSEDDKKN